MPKKDNNKNKKEKKNVKKNNSITIELEATPVGRRHKVSEIGLTVFAKQEKVSLNMSLQFGNGSDWETIRVIQTDSIHSLPMQSVVRTGDGVKKFRLLVENETNQDADFFYWFDSVLVAI